MKRIGIVVLFVFIQQLAAAGGFHKARVVAENGLVLRAKPELAASRITKIPNGTIITVLANSGGYVDVNGKNGVWYEVSHLDKKGYVFGAYLDLNYANTEVKTIVGTIAEIEYGDLLHISVAVNGKEISLIGYAGLPEDEVFAESDNKLIGKKVKVTYKKDTFFLQAAGGIVTFDSAISYEIIH